MQAFLAVDAYININGGIVIIFGDAYSFILYKSTSMVHGSSFKQFYCVNKCLETCQQVIWTPGVPGTIPGIFVRPNKEMGGYLVN